MDLWARLYARRQAIRSLSDAKLCRRVWAARMRLSHHERSEAEFRDARDWTRERRREERERIEGEIAVLMAEYQRRPLCARWPAGRP